MIFYDFFFTFAAVKFIPQRGVPRKDKNNETQRGKIVQI